VRWPASILEDDAPPKAPTLIDYVRDSWLVAGDAPAVFSSGAAWTYDQLLGLAARVDLILGTSFPTERQRTIGVYAGRTAIGYAAMLAIMNRGDIYVPLSPTLADGQIGAIIDLARLSCVLIDPVCRRSEAVLQAARQCRVPIVPIAEEQSCPTVPLQPSRAREQDVAYLLFTSGTTGRPKGVPVTHMSARSCLDAVAGQLELRADDRVAQFADVGFDISIAETFLAWMAGACLYAPSPAELMTPCAYVRRHRLTIWSSVPTLAANARALEGLDEASMPSLRLSLFCGEALPTSLAADWKRSAPASRMINLYGPTEATIFATMNVWDGETSGDGIVPIGRPLDGMRVQIDRGMRLSGPGELLLAGPQIMEGYWRDPEADGRSFVTADRDDETERWYRTGDLVVQDRQGRLVFVGRIDRQVKIRGYRVELASIEQAAVRATGCKSAIAVPERDSDGLCTSVVLLCQGLAEDEQTARRACSRLLPSHAVPRRIVGVETLPITHNGKVNHQALAQIAVALG